MSSRFQQQYDKVGEKLWTRVSLKESKCWIVKAGSWCIYTHVSEGSTLHVVKAAKMFSILQTLFWKEALFPEFPLDIFLQVLRFMSRLFSVDDKHLSSPSMKLCRFPLRFKTASTIKWPDNGRLDFKMMQQINHTLFSMFLFELLKTWHRFQPQYTFSQTFGCVLIVKAHFKHRREAGVEA